MTDKKLWYGWTSKEASKKGVGTFRFSDAEGKDHVVNGVCRDPECQGIVWPDKEVVPEPLVAFEGRVTPDRTGYSYSEVKWQ